MAAPWTNGSKETSPEQEASGRWRASVIVSFLRLLACPRYSVTRRPYFRASVLDLRSADSTIDLSNTIYLVQQQAGAPPPHSAVRASDTPASCLLVLGVLTYCITEEKETNIKQSCSRLRCTVFIFCITPLALRLLAQIMQFRLCESSVIDLFSLRTCLFVALIYSHLFGLIYCADKRTW